MLTKEYVESLIVKETYINGHDKIDLQNRFLGFADDNPNLRRITFCILELKSGAFVTGCAIASNLSIYDCEKGQNAARSRAIDELYKLEGYVLATKSNNSDNITSDDNQEGRV